ncbi:39S ribosomal protein L48, mitochondrial isoform X2 [Salmo salar]|uniref:39S ribosomal protein L48, mitochondrial isoform X2 n=1 Tax=Salmo salar TaxID=8030 RepID=A0ABM3CQ73_SALSA|nr:39S ribosomal protein L48, mitochondrial isoform X2 [Salmo salar]
MPRCSGIKRSLAFPNERQYRTRPTHGIGKYKHLLTKEAPKKERQQMKEIKTATDAEYGTLNVKVSGYALPTKSTEVMVMPEQGTKMYVDAILKTHERIVQHTEADYQARFKARPELEGLMAQIT